MLNALSRPELSTSAENARSSRVIGAVESPYRGIGRRGRYSMAAIASLRPARKPWTIGPYVQRPRLRVRSAVSLMTS